MEVIYLPQFSKLLDAAYESHCLNIIYEYDSNLLNNTNMKMYHIMICNTIYNINDFKYLGKFIHHEIIKTSYNSLALLFNNM